MNRRTFLSAACAAAAQAQPVPPPNILFIMADDLGYGDLGCYGQKHIPTPHLDQLAAGGLRFTDAYAGCTVCAPSRSVLMTGKHMGHTSIRANTGGIPLLPEDVTVAEVLRTAGYKTGCFGKWGLGDHETVGVPTKQGFDVFYGVLHQVHAHYHYPGYVFSGESMEEAPRGPGRTFTQYTNDAVVSMAEGFIRQHAREKNPFFCYLPLTIPHLELLAPREKMEQFEGKISEDGPYVDPRNHYANQPKPRTAYAAMISRMDDYIGRLVELLDKEKVAANTIVFFCSDNGSATPIWNDGGYFNSSGPLRGHKTTFYEGGIRTPMIVSWKGRIKPGVSAFPWMFQDVLPTLAELARATPPKDIDGLSIVPTLLGAGKQAQHEYLYWELPRHYPISGTFAEETPRQAVRQGKWKAVRPEANGPLELYDLSNDLGERKNVAAQNPAVVAKMEAICKAARVTPRKQTQPDNWQWK
jgi:arylsulfatase A